MLDIRHNKLNTTSSGAKTGAQNMFDSFEGLKVANEIFTWNGRKYHMIGRYGGHKWHGFWFKVLDAREVFPLSTSFWLARLGSRHKS